MNTEPETKLIDAKTPSTTQKPPAEPVLGAQRVVGRYELIHRLGHGGMATVHLGRATGTAGFEKLVAVKVIHPHLADEPEFVDMFLDEARIAAHIRHPHVVEIHDLGSAEGVFYMVMEFVEGATLSSLLRQLRNRDRTLPIPVVLQIMADACEGLAAAHELRDRDGKSYGLVHRDVSPQNFLVSMTGWVKLVDFGIMKAAGKRSTTLTGQLRGKLPYMSPEQANSLPVDPRTDLFALGAVLWELLTNERLFAGGSEMAVLEKVTSCELPDIFEIRRDLPRGFDGLLHKTLARSPEDRYDSAREMLADVKLMQRETAAEGDPRRQLAGVMQRHFSKQVEYARAAVRGVQGGSGELDVAIAPDQSASSGIPDSGGARGLISATTPSRLGGLPAGSSTHTLSSTLATTPTRYWALWVVLPLIGAAIGTAVMALDRGNGNAAAPPATAPTDVRPAAATSEPSEIVWTLNTHPQGATVVVAGEPYQKKTPTEITMPRGEEAIKVRFELAGYAPSQLQLRPTRHENVTVPLKQLTSPTAAAPGATTVAAPKPVGKRKRGGSRTKAAKPAKSDGSNEDKHKGKRLKPPRDFGTVSSGGG